MGKAGRAALAVVLAAALAPPLAGASPAALDAVVAASDRPGGYDYVVETVVVDVAGTLTFVNADLRTHDVVSFAFGPASNPWCIRYEEGACPLFATPWVDFGGAVAVDGIGQLTPLASYGFYCTLHPWMTGTLVAI